MADPLKTQQTHLSPEDQDRQKARLFTRGTPSTKLGISDALVIKDQDMFFLCERDGCVPRHTEHGLGLYYHDCRYLDTYHIAIQDRPLDDLVATSRHGSKMIVENTNLELEGDDGQPIEKEKLGFKIERLISGEHRSLIDRMTLTNFGVDPVEFTMSLEFASRFEDVFNIRGLLDVCHGAVHEPEWIDQTLRLRYDGKDGLYRWVDIGFSVKPDLEDGGRTEFKVALDSEESYTFDVWICLYETPDEPGPPLHRCPDFDRESAMQERKRVAWLEGHTEGASNSMLFDRILDRALLDLELLRSQLGTEEYFAAGIPWFGALFGRDTLITGIETLCYEPALAEQILRLLASFQGKREDPWREEQPGKILHELRVGELAHLDVIPQTPYYGSIDATPLFLVLAGLHAKTTGNLDVFEDLRPPIEHALAWIGRYGDLDGDGFVEYSSLTRKGLVNQAWKDSGDGIVMEDGCLARPPIAMAEVQGYVYMAKLLIADCLEAAAAEVERVQRTGQSSDICNTPDAAVGQELPDPDLERQRARTLRTEAAALRYRFNEVFWLEDEGIYAMCLDGRKKPSRVVSSNAGQVLWTGIADPDKARRTADRLLQPDMFNGWGIRTLSSRERRYNPIGYHIGTVWPHDNALIAAGFRRYGLDDQAMRIFEGIFDAASFYPNYRLPEAFSGFSRETYDLPVAYPVACHPQAWAAGSVPYMIATLLGLEPDALNGKLRIVRPLLTLWAEWITIRNMAIGDACVNLTFRRGENRAARCAVDEVNGDLKVEVEG